MAMRDYGALSPGNEAHKLSFGAQNGWVVLGGGQKVYFKICLGVLSHIVLLLWKRAPAVHL